MNGWTISAGGNPTYSIITNQAITTNLNINNNIML
jgi:hypothetical protein